MVIVYEMESVIPVQILNDDVCISNRTNTLGKGMNPTILSPAIGK